MHTGEKCIRETNANSHEPVRNHLTHAFRPGHENGNMHLDLAARTGTCFVKILGTCFAKVLKKKKGMHFRNMPNIFGRV